MFSFLRAAPFARGPLARRQLGQPREQRFVTGPDRRFEGADRRQWAATPVVEQPPQRTMKPVREAVAMGLRRFLSMAM